VRVDAAAIQRWVGCLTDGMIVIQPPQPEDLTVHVEEDIADLVDGFLANQRKVLADLQRPGILNDDVRKGGHSMKGVGGMYGFHWISRFGAHLEKIAVSNPEEIPAMLQMLGDYLESVTFKVIPSE
jgi:hypothetical protein